MDFEILWRKIHASLTKSEEEALEDWLNEHEKHRKLFEDAKKYYKHGSDFGKRPADVQEAWRKISDITTGKRRKKTQLRAVFYAAAASIALLLVTNYYWKPFGQHPDQISESIQNIEPGSDKAILIMEDGTSHDLSAGQELELDVEGVNISSHGTSISYSQTGEQKDRSSRRQGRAEIRYNTLKVPRGGEFYLTLADQTKVWLNSETTLRYPVEFTGEERRVELTGEAFFEVAKDAERPFRVVSDEQVVEVLGTSFNISSYPEDSLILTTLVNGTVNVFLGDSPETRQTLLPNHQSYLAKGEDRIMQREVDVMEYVAWKDGEFYFKDQSLENIMKTLSRWYDIDVVFSEPQAKDILFTGHLERYENFERLLNLIEQTNEVSYSEEGRTITIDIIY